MKKLFHTSFLCLALCLSACGGGSSSTPASSSGGVVITPPPPAASTNNQTPIVVDAGIVTGANIPFVSVTLCTPGSASACQTIDHILLDTGSNGLRVFASVLSPALSLPFKQTASGATVAECAQFADGYTWGAVKFADFKMAGEQVSRMAVEVIGGPGLATAPSACTSTGSDLGTPEAFGANGVLGVGVFQQDCGPGCSTSANNGFYYACSSIACTQTMLALSEQVANPVSLFASDNNGIIVTMAGVGDGGAVSSSGTLTFGVGTQSNNANNAGAVLLASENTGYVSTFFNGHSYTDSYFDTGSNGLFFRDAQIPTCSSGFYCPTTRLALSAQAGATTVSFAVENSDTLFAFTPSRNAFSTLAGTLNDDTTFAWGLPFFFGRSVYVVQERQVTARGTGPYFAF